MQRKLGLVVLFVIATAITLQFGLSNLYAANKIDCAQVMNELQGGKKVSEVAKDMKISKSSVYRCRKAAAKASGGGASSPAAMASPAMAPKKN